MPTDFRSVAGQYSGTTLQTRNIFSNLSPAQIQYLPSLAIIDGAKSRDTGSSPVGLLRAGLLMGKITTGGKYRPSIIGLTNGAITSGSATTITVPAAVATEVARLITAAGGNVNLTLISVPSAAGTKAATNIVATAASGTTITITSASLPDAVDKSIIAPRDGSETPTTVIPNAAGIEVVDSNAASLDQHLSLFLRGADLITSQLIAGASAVSDLDTSLQTWIKQQLNGGGTSTRGNFTFSDDRP